MTTLNSLRYQPLKGHISQRGFYETLGWGVAEDLGNNSFYLILQIFKIKWLLSISSQITKAYK